MQRVTRNYVAVAKAEQIERQINQGNKKPMVLGIKYHSKNCSGICAICGEPFSMITKAHATKHGFPDPDTMIAAGAVRWL
jgi:hypothetical protein